MSQPDAARASAATARQGEPEHKGVFPCVRVSGAGGVSSGVGGSSDNGESAGTGSDRSSEVASASEEGRRRSAGTTAKHYKGVPSGCHKKA